MLVGGLMAVMMVPCGRHGGNRVAGKAGRSQQQKEAQDASDVSDAVRQFMSEMLRRR